MGRGVVSGRGRGGQDRDTVKGEGSPASFSAQGTRDRVGDGGDGPDLQPLPPKGHGTGVGKGMGKVGQGMILRWRYNHSFTQSTRCRNPAKFQIGAGLLEDQTKGRGRG